MRSHKDNACQQIRESTPENGEATNQAGPHSENGDSLHPSNSVAAEDGIKIRRASGSDAAAIAALCSEVWLFCRLSPRLGFQFLNAGWHGYGIDMQLIEAHLEDRCSSCCQVFGPLAFRGFPSVLKASAALQQQARVEIYKDVDVQLRRAIDAKSQVCYHHTLPAFKFDRRQISFRAQK